MPITTPGGQFTTPDGDVEPQVHVDLANLAEQVEERALIQTAGAMRRLHVRTWAAGAYTTDANGFVTIPHGADFIPFLAIPWNTNPASYFANPWGTDQYTSTTFRVRYQHAGNAGPLASGNIGPGVVLLLG